MSRSAGSPQFQAIWPWQDNFKDLFLRKRRLEQWVLNPGGSLSESSLFAFKPSHFDPPSSKDRLVLQFATTIPRRIDGSRHSQSELNHFLKFKPFIALRDSLAKTWPFSLQKLLCTCNPPVSSPDDAHRCPCISDLFFAQSPETASRLPTTSHSITFDSHLYSLRIPSLDLDHKTSTLSLDWRPTVSQIYSKELHSRRFVAHWLRNTTLLSNPSRLVLHGDFGKSDSASYTVRDFVEGWQRNGWVSWTEDKDLQTCAVFDLEAAQPNDRIFQLPVHFLGHHTRDIQDD